LIERALPDPAVYAGFRQASLESVRWSTASVHPANGKPYPFEPGEAGRYSLCAEFALPSDQEPRAPPRRSDDRFWSHPAGPHCFEIEARDRG
jgi:hypothetical protein